MPRPSIREPAERNPCRRCSLCRGLSERRTHPGLSGGTDADLGLPAGKISEPRITAGSASPSVEGGRRGAWGVTVDRKLQPDGLRALGGELVPSMRLRCLTSRQAAILLRGRLQKMSSLQEAGEGESSGVISIPHRPA